MVKNLPAMLEIWLWSQGREDPLEKEMANHSSILAWRIPWTQESGRIQSMGSQRVGHDWANIDRIKPNKEMGTCLWGISEQLRDSSGRHSLKLFIIYLALLICIIWIKNIHLNKTYNQRKKRGVFAEGPFVPELTPTNNLKNELWIVISKWG